MLMRIEKLTARIKQLEGFRYRDAIKIPAFHYQLDEEGSIGARPPREGEWKEIRVGEAWKGRDLYMWLRTETDVPLGWKGRKVLGRFDFGTSSNGLTKGFESLLYLNDRPFQGVDMNHQEVFLPSPAAGKTFAFAFRLWSGLEGGGRPKEQEHRLNRAELCWLDESADDLYYTALAAIDKAKRLEENIPEREDLITAVDRAFLQLDWSRPGSDAFYESVAGAADVLKEQLAAIEKRHPITVQCIGHTHIDVAWLWRLKHTREKSARSFSTVLRLMELYPEYVFLQTQPQLYEYIKEDYPELYGEIRERVKEGRWEADGAMWLEADCNLTSGESLVRQLLLGTRFFREEFGTECKYLWLPDVFGYSWALPQILRKCGIDTFMTTKISWSRYNRMPHDTFHWRGIDGSEVLTHFITTTNALNLNSKKYTYNGTITPYSVDGIWQHYRDKAVNKELLLAYGYGDGGGGVNREMLEMRRRLDRMPGLPKLTTGRADDYFARLQETFRSTDQYVHTWDGELYLELHQGTFTSQAYNKRMNRKLELLLRETEWLGVLAAVQTDNWTGDDRETLNESWKIVLRNQFHDIIPGSSIKEVYEDSRIEYEEAERLAIHAWRKAADTVADAQTEAFTVYNNADWARSELVLIEGQSAAVSWSDETGHAMLAQRSGDGWLVRVDGIPSLGGKVIRCTPGKRLAEAETSPFQEAERGITTPFYEIEWNANGQLVRIYDQANRREVLAGNGRGNVLQVFEDKPLTNDAWDIDIFYQEKMNEIRDLKSAAVVEAGPLRAVVRFRWTYMRSEIEQDMVVYADSRRIDFVTRVDWHEQQRLLKAAFPVRIRSTEATYDIQYGNVKRPTHWNTSWDSAMYEVVGHQWADLSEGNYGVSLLNDCKYGYDIKDNVMRLSLIKSAIHPDYQADQGEHRFTYALLPHDGDWRQGGTVQEAWSLNNPLTWAPGGSAAAGKSLFSHGCRSVQIDAVKKAEDAEAVVLRLHEFEGNRERIELRSDYPIASWQECDLLERPTQDSQTVLPLAFEIQPYEIKTFLVHFRKKSNS